MDEKQEVPYERIETDDPPKTEQDTDTSEEIQLEQKETETSSKASILKRSKKEKIERTPEEMVKHLKKIRIVLSIIIGVLSLVIIFLFLCVGVTAMDLENSDARVETLQASNDTLSEKVTELQDELAEYKYGPAAQLSEIKDAFSEQKWQDVIDKANHLHTNYAGAAEDAEAQELAKQAQEKLDEAAAAAEAEKAKGYETGITYDQLARTPDDFEGKKVKFSGRVIQVVEGAATVRIRLAVNDDYGTILYGTYVSSIVPSRVLEDDYITVYGTSKGIYTYESTMGNSVSIPQVSIDKIDQ